MADTVIGMIADLGAPLSNTIFASDAMGANTDGAGGFGVVASSCAMGIAQLCFGEGLTPGHTVCRLDGSFAGMKRPDQKVGRTIPFTRVPQQTLDGTWTPLIWGRWSFEDHITP